MNTDKKLRIIITGATGMVGEGVLYECLQHAQVEQVLVLVRKTTGVNHPKLKELIHADFYNLSAVETELSGYNTCFFCLGVSSVGMKEPEYFKLTHTLTLHVAETLSRLNSEMSFCYISGAGTNSSEQGGQMWSRVKGRTENDLFKLPFKEAYAFRPGFIKPIKGLKHTHAFYRYINWMFPIGRMLYPKGFCTLQELGQAMIKTALQGYQKRVLEGTDIIALAASRE